MPFPPPAAIGRGRPLVVALVVVISLLGSSCSELFPPDDTDAGRNAVRVVGQDWLPSTPTRAGFDGASLLEIVEDLGTTDTNIHRVVAAKDGRLGLDANLYPAPSRGRQDLGALTQSVVALVVLAAVERGDIESLDAPLGSLLDLPDGSAAADVSLRDLLGMRAGLDCSRANDGRQLTAMLSSANFVATAAAIERERPPGRVFAFCSPTYHLVSAAVTAATGQPLADYADEVLFDPLSIDSWIWPADAQGITHGWGDLQLEPHDLARLGQLVLDDGIAFDRRLLPRDVVAMFRDDAIEAEDGDDFALGWWLPTPIGDSPPLEGRATGGQSLLLDDEQGFLALAMGAAADGTTFTRRLAGATLPRPIPDLASDKLIGEELERLQGRPDPGPTTAPSGRARIGTTIRLEPNRRGYESMAVVPAGAGVQVQLVVDGTIIYLPVPLDGVPTVVQLSLDDGPAAVTGTWTGNTLQMDHESIEGPGHLVLDLNIGLDPFLRVTDLNSTRPPLLISYALVPPDAQTPDP